MKKNKLFLVLIAVFGLLFTSCSKEEDQIREATITFGAVLNNMETRSMEALEDLPTCSDADPAYVDIILTGPENIGSMEAPRRIFIDDATGNTEPLTVKEGDYTLNYFVVYDIDGNVIWIAPNDGELSSFVEQPLPQDLTVMEGTDNEVVVDVVCYDDRDILVEAFGPLYFILNPGKAIEFCLVGDTCDDTDLNFTTSVWLGTDASGTQLYSDLANDGSDSPALCMALPDLEGEDNYYFEVSLDGTLIRKGAITDADIKALFPDDNTVEPYIFYQGENCTETDSPALFEVVSDSGSGSGEVNAISLPYSETFEDATADLTLADYGYSLEHLTTETVPNPGNANLTSNDFADGSAWGIQYGYVNNNADTDIGLVDNVVITPLFSATAGTYQLSYDIAYIKSLAEDQHGVEVYWSDDSDGSFNNGTWTQIDYVTEADGAVDEDDELAARKEFETRTKNFTVSGNFYVAFRFKADIQADGDGTRWRLDNIEVADDNGSGGEGTGSTFTDYIETFEDFDESATYDPPYLQSKGFEQYQFTTFAEENNVLFEAETNGKYPSLEDVTVEGGSGFQFTYFAETGSTEPGAGVFGDFDVVLVSPGQENANGDFTVNIDARRFFSETSGTVTWYWTNNYTPGEGFTEANWNSLGTDDAQDLNDSGSFLRKSFNIPSSSGTLYFAVRVEGSVDDGGTPDTTRDGNYRFRVRFDNLQITKN